MAGVLVDGSSQLTELKERVIQMLRDAIPYAQIEQETGVKGGTIRQWASRNGLTLKAMSHSVSQAPATKPKADNASSYSATTRVHLAKRLDKLAAKVDSFPVPKSKKDIGLQADLCAKIAQPASLVHGWSTTTNNTVVNIAALMSAQVVQPDTSDTPPATAQVIDVDQSPATIEDKASLIPVPPPQ